MALPQRGRNEAGRHVAFLAAVDADHPVTLALQGHLAILAVDVGIRHDRLQRPVLPGFLDPLIGVVKTEAEQGHLDVGLGHHHQPIVIAFEILAQLPDHLAIAAHLIDIAAARRILGHSAEAFGAPMIRAARRTLRRSHGLTERASWVITIFVSSQVGAR
jgi:hypothetical protein